MGYHRHTIITICIGRLQLLRYVLVCEQLLPNENNVSINVIVHTSLFIYFNNQNG